jgi:malonyl-CoA O-methyltransferase
MTFLRRLRARLTKRKLPMLASRRAYAYWATSYPSEPHNPLMQVEQSAVLSLLPSLAQKSVLDIGAGTGRYTKIADENGASSVWSMDDSWHMLQHNQASQRVQASALALPLPKGCFDVVISALVMGHISSLESYLAEIARLMKPNGVAILSDFHPHLATYGAQRTFQHQGKTLAVEHYVHHPDEVKTLAQANGLQLEQTQEPELEKNGRQLKVVIVYRFCKATSTV